MAAPPADSSTASNLELTNEPHAEDRLGEQEEVKDTAHVQLPNAPLPWGSVVKSVFSLEVEATYRMLEAELSLGDGATEYGTVLAAVDRSSRNLFLSVRLARTAQIVDEQYSMELDKRLEALRTAAAGFLEEDKKNGLRSKAPTLEDIRLRMLADWPDEVTALTKRKSEMHGMLRVIEALEPAWRERCESLRTMAHQFKRSGT